MKENTKALRTINGTSVTGNYFLADSGFRYCSGIRNLGNLNIVEDVAQGRAICYLCGIKVYDKEGTMILDKKLKNGVHYEREKVRRIVLQEILNMLHDTNAENPDFDLEKAKKTIDNHLKQAYFSQSYKALNNWALEMGIL